MGRLNGNPPALGVPGTLPPGLVNPPHPGVLGVTPPDQLGVLVPLAWGVPGTDPSRSMKLGHPIPALPRLSVGRFLIGCGIGGEEMRVVRRVGMSGRGRPGSAEVGALALARGDETRELRWETAEEGSAVNCALLDPPLVTRLNTGRPEDCPDDWLMGEVGITVSAVSALSTLALGVTESVDRLSPTLDSGGVRGATLWGNLSASI